MTTEPNVTPDKVEADTPVPTPPEPEEILVADPRNALTPSQMVDQKLLALLATCNAGLVLQASGLGWDIRRIPTRR
jgi:hypothetical protein